MKPDLQHFWASLRLCAYMCAAGYWRGETALRCWSFVGATSSSNKVTINFLQR